MEIREATLKDMEQIIGIWQDRSIESLGKAPSDEHTKILVDTIEGCITDRNPSFRVWVADRDGAILGWQSLLPCTSNPFSRYNRAESSTYTRRRSGDAFLGYRLVKHAVEFAEQSPLVAIIAILRSNNLAIQRIGRKLGFINVGDFPLIPGWSVDVMRIYIRPVDGSIKLEP